MKSVREITNWLESYDAVQPSKVARLGWLLTDGNCTSELLMDIARGMADLQQHAEIMFWLDRPIKDRRMLVRRVLLLVAVARISGLEECYMLAGWYAGRSGQTMSAITILREGLTYHPGSEVLSSYLWGAATGVDLTKAAPLTLDQVSDMQRKRLQQHMGVTDN